MKTKIIILFFMFMVLCSFAYADDIEANSLFYPDDMNFTYNVSTNFSADEILVNDTCVVITNGTYDGEYCYNITDIHLSDIVLFPDATPPTCYATFVDFTGTIFNVEYVWLDRSGNTLKTGSAVCDHNTECEIDTLEASLVDSGDTITCQLKVYSDWFNSTNFQSETLNVSTIGDCGVTNPYPLVNISYFNELNDSPIQARNVVNATFYDGVTEFYFLANYSNNFTDIICTSIDPSITVINLLMYGQYIVSRETFITRVFEIPQVAGILTSNLVPNTLDLYLVPLANSSTITYTWQTTDFQFVEGTMLIYRCDDDHNKTLISANKISGGTTTANLQLFTIPYSYEVVIGGTRYTDDSFTKCRVESKTENQFYVDVSSTQILPLLGLLLVDCSLTRIANDTARIDWAANTEDDGVIEGCIEAYQETIAGRNLIYRSCLNSSSGSFTRVIPNDGNRYYVIGTISQNGYIGYCQNPLSFFEESTPSNILGRIGIFGIVILIMALTLFYPGEPELQLLAAGLSIVLVFVMGLLSFPWEAIAAILGFLLAIALIGRYSKKRGTE